MILLMFILATGCWAQNDINNKDYLDIVPIQKLLHHLINSNNIIFFRWQRIEGGIGIIGVPNLNMEKIFDGDRKIERETIQDSLKARLKLLKEIVEYHRAIKKAKQELAQLRQERDNIIKKLDFLKVRLNRLQ